MNRQLTLEQVRVCRLMAQRLHPATVHTGGDPALLIRQLGGLQAQELPAAHLAVRARSRELLSEDVRRVREDDRALVLTWLMRGTMHLVHADDLPWLLPLLGPRFIHKSQSRYRQLGLDEATRERAAHLMRDELGKRGPLTRPELAAALTGHGIPVAGQAIHHLVRAAALNGVICFGPERNGALTYVALADWLALHHPALTPEQAVAELARRYLGAYNPATPEDFARWAGLTRREAQAGFAVIADELVAVEALGEAAWLLRENVGWLEAALTGPVVQLLPRYDTYLLGHTSRAFMVADPFAKRVHPGGGQIQQTVLVNGEAVATWRKKNKTAIMLEPFEPLNEALVSLLEAEVQDMGRFLGQDLRLHG